MENRDIRGYVALMTPAQEQAICDVPHFRDSIGRHYDLPALLGQYKARFVDQAPTLVGNASLRIVADIGTGYGWLAIAFALYSTAKVIAVDRDVPRIEAAQKIAAIMGVADRIEWRVGSLGSLPLQDREADAVYCIEVIEHTGIDPRFLRDLARVADEIVVVTTPNAHFPIIGHDTALPFCHMLPMAWRTAYARLFGREDRQDGNQFWSAAQLMNGFYDFHRASRFLHFASYDEYAKVERSLTDYRSGRSSIRQTFLQAYLRVAAIFGERSIHLLPNLATTFRRREADS